MIIPFLRVGKTPLAITEELSSDGSSVALAGELVHHQKGLIKLIGTLSGKTVLQCDRCAEDFECELNEPVELLLSSGIYKEDDEDEHLSWPVMEMQNDKIDLKEVLESELAAFSCGYHRCTDCESGLTNFELTQGE